MSSASKYLLLTMLHYHNTALLIRLMQPPPTYPEEMSPLTLSEIHTKKARPTHSTIVDKFKNLHLNIQMMQPGESQS